MRDMYVDSLLGRQSFFSVFQWLEKSLQKVPMIGKIGKKSSNGWKLVFLAGGLWFGTVGGVLGVVTTYYVDAGRPNDLGDGLSWAAAKQSIQAAVDLTVDGDTVLVTNGVYNVGSVVPPLSSSTNRVCITNAITVQSVHGAAVTTIDGGGLLRCVYVSQGTMIGFTLTNGTAVATAWSRDDYGGGAFVQNNGVLSNCTLSGCSGNYGGGAYVAGAGVLNHCTLSGNSVVYSGGGAYVEDGILNHCTLSENSAGYAGGGAVVTMGVLNNCTLSGNSALEYGAGAYMGWEGSTLNNCTLSGNSGANYGGGAMVNGGTMNNCLLSGNAGGYGGGVSLEGDGYGLIAIACEGTPGYAGEGDDGHSDAFEAGQQAEELFRLAAVAHGDDHIAGADHAEVAMQRLDGMEHDGRGASAGKGGRHFASDGQIFSDAGDHDFSAVAQGFQDEFNGTPKLESDAVAHLLHGFDFRVEHLFGFFCVFQVLFSCAGKSIFCPMKLDAPLS